MPIDPSIYERAILPVAPNPADQAAKLADISAQIAQRNALAVNTREHAQALIQTAKDQALAQNVLTQTQGDYRAAAQAAAAQGNSRVSDALSKAADDRDKAALDAQKSRNDNLSTTLDLSDKLIGAIGPKGENYDLVKAPLRTLLQPIFGDQVTQAVPDAYDPSVGPSLSRMNQDGKTRNTAQQESLKLVTDGKPIDAIARSLKGLQADPQMWQAQLQHWASLGLPTDLIAQFATPMSDDALDARTQTSGTPDQIADAQYQAIAKKKALGQPLSPEDAATMKAYEQRKLIGPEATAAAASDRLASTQAAANARLDKTEAFTEAEAGRASLDKNVETPYRTAIASSQTLRDTVSAAQGGNVTAANLQGLETAMSAIRAQGLNRINTTELGVAGNAGSTWQRIQGWFGKAATGQPIPASVQKDILAFADILDKAAYQKYSQGFDSTTKRYGLSDEQKLGAPSGASSAASPATKILHFAGGLDVPVTAQADGTWTSASGGVYDASGKRVK